MDETSSSTFHPIACESCRNKKSKCDRELPICSQCSSSDTLCRYPPINKRGIPSGYISFIEQRLLETEIVVLELLSAIYESRVPIEPQRLPERDRRLLSEYGQKQAKTHKIEEWRNLPLTTEEQRRTWWLKKSERIAKAAETSGDHPTQRSPAATSPWAANSSRNIHDESTQVLLGAEQATILPGQPPGMQVSWRPVADGTGLSEPDTNLEHLDQNTTGFSPLEDISGEGYPDVPEAPTPPCQSTLQSHSAADARWRKYF
ncbi:hypothetical protein COCSADRAFT_315933 [Bipolaris sorokiniana ND90Pr]|uniref:Zn(2)-C6 fungal-type domain-containing protein n=1 Tax=Cochliobolus sativus (strain ND90Pr / ATCC 201652) TaxID=665912 RepID=M2SRJ2_COCSN|nr:uncharacterized protein COCSADRAFT_315933 [Bipolaris sorokiniana ND90Pr]EMD64905.1 hypothetical protein COCSADRAFT_315933 [Bipolaris sorokiniana ND90Pr]